MKRGDLIRLLVSNGCHLHRHGANHDLYASARMGKKTAVPRHAEIGNTLVALILKQLQIDITKP